jgi:hypothetical protein
VTTSFDCYFRWCASCKYKDSFANYFKALGSTVLLCLLLADLYKEDILRARPAERN